MKKTTRKQKRWAIKYLRTHKFKAIKMLLAYEILKVLIYDDNFEPVKYEDVDREKYLNGEYHTSIILIRADDITYHHGVERILKSEEKWERGLWPLFKAWFYASDYFRLGQGTCYNTVVNNIIYNAAGLFSGYLLCWLNCRAEQIKLGQDAISFEDYVRNEFTCYRNIYIELSKALSAASIQPIIFTTILEAMNTAIRIRYATMAISLL